MASSEELTVRVGGMSAYVVVDRFVHGLAAGGLRFSPSVDLEELRRLARVMTYKWALLRIPIGGCKLGVRGDPAKNDKRIVLRAFARSVRGFLRDRIITGPDMGTSAEDLNYFFREMGQDSYTVASRSLEERGYSPTPREAYRNIMRDIQGTVTGLAVARAAEEAWRKLEGSLEDAAVSIQGFGSVGRVVAEEMTRLGAKVVCLADAKGALWDPRGLNVASLVGDTPGIMDRSRLGSGTEELPGERWAEVDVDILVPAAVADAINWDNAPRVKARMVVEAANIPVPEDVELHLHERGVLVLPDFVVNAGLAGAFGVLVTQEWQRSEDVMEEVIRRIASSTSKVVEESLNWNRPPREMAIALARKRNEF